MARVLLVGGAGYVGCVLAEELLQRGYAVRILDRLYFGDQGLREIRDRVELVVGDMRTPKQSVLEGVVAVVNIAGLSNDPTAEYNPQANEEMNTVAARRLAELGVAAGVRRYVYGSSCSIYDRGVANPVEDVIQEETSPVAPRAAYSTSKLNAEKLLLEMKGKDFCPVILRKGTVFGFSPRMRYDLVVNTFVKDALSTGRITLHYGGEMWRPLVDVRDAARAYLVALEAPEEKVCGEIFNVASGNYRISELALRVRVALREAGHDAEIVPDYGYHGVRSYRVSADKIDRVLGYRPKVTVEESVKEMVRQITSHGMTDWDNPRYYNIRWMQLLEEAHDIIGITGSVFGAGRPVEHAVS